jgi:hypothetical protein
MSAADDLTDDERRAMGFDRETPDGAPTETSTWQAVDLTDALTGVDVPGPTVLARTDGVRLLYAGRTHQFAGESESCKTWAALVAAGEVLGDGGSVLWIDFEDDANGIVARLRSLMVDTEDVRQRFVYVRPDEPLAARDGKATAGGVDFANLLDRAYTLAVIDGVTEAMATEGLDLISNADIAKWSRLLPKRIAAVTGAAVVCIDHVVKNSDTRGRFAIGGQHKLAGLTGAAYRFDVTRKLSRAIREPVYASITITVVKDRPGHVRAHAAGDTVGVLEVNSYPDGSVTAAIVPSGAASRTPDLALVMLIVDYLRQYDGATKNTLTTEVTGKAEAIREAITWMVEPERGWIRIERVGQAHRHFLTDAGKADMS